MVRALLESLLFEIKKHWEHNNQISLLFMCIQHGANTLFTEKTAKGLNVDQITRIRTYLLISILNWTFMLIRL